MNFSVVKFSYFRNSLYKGFPLQIQSNLRKMVESIEKNNLVQSSSSPTSSSTEDSEEYKVLAEELAILATELETKCLEVQSYKENFEVLQNDCAERTSELERFNSQLQKAKLDGNTAVEKLKKSEEDLAQIKEKNAQLSDELLNKSRQVSKRKLVTESWTLTFTAAKLSTYLFQIAAIENSGGSSHGTASGSDAKVQQLQQKCDLLQKKLDAASVASLGSSAPTGKTFFFSRPIMGWEI